VILVLSFIPVYFYPITKEKHEEMRAKLAEKQKGMKSQ
jgi:Na+/melibiose symporter-like transporter